MSWTFWFTNLFMAWHRHTSLRLTNCQFLVSNSQPTATELFQSPLYGSGTFFRSISHLLRHFPSSALAWRHTSPNSVTRNYCCHACEVTLSFMDTLIALTYSDNKVKYTLHSNNIQVKHRQRHISQSVGTNFNDSCSMWLWFTSCWDNAVNLGITTFTKFVLYIVDNITYTVNKSLAAYKTLHTDEKL